jgi:quinol monooxygenase YgiN
MQSSLIKQFPLSLKNLAVTIASLLLSLTVAAQVHAEQVVVGKFMAKPEKQAELIQLAQGMFEPSRAEPGCISYEFYEDTQGDHTFVFVESWKNQEALDQHFQTAYFKRFMAQFSDMIIGKPVIKVFEVASEKQL